MANSQKMLKNTRDRNPEEPIQVLTSTRNRKFDRHFPQKGLMQKITLDSGLLRKQVKERRIYKEWSLKSDKMNKEDLIRVSRMMGWNSKTLHKVRLEFSRYDGEINRDLKEVGKVLKRMVGLKELFVSFSSFVEITDKGVKSLVEVLKRLKGLEMLTIKFIGNDGVTDEGILKLTRCLRRMCSLKGIVFRLSSMKKIGDTAIENILNGIKRLPRFQDLNLDFSNTKITDKECEFMRKSLKSDLRSFVLNIDWGYGKKRITEKGFKALGEGLERLSKLKKIKMSLQREMNDKEFEYISEGIRNMVAIEDIELKFYMCKEVGDKGVKSLGRSIKKLKYLKKIGLEFSGVKISDEGICGLFEGVEARKESLQILKVKIIGPENVTDEGMRRMGMKIKELELLKSFDLEFLGDGGVKDKGIENLSQGIKELKNLQDLKLNFFLCNGFGDEGLQRLGEALGEMLSLQELSIDICGKRKMSDAGLEGLMEGIKKLRGLKRLNMDLIGLNGIKEKGMKILSEGLKEMEGLQRVSLDLAKCNWVDEQGVLKLVDELKGLIWLKNVELGVAHCKKMEKKGMEGLKIKDVEVRVYERAIRNLNGPLLL